MRSSSRVSRKSLAFITALATVLALAVPLMGTAGATHGQGTDADVDVDTISLTPEASSNVSGSCQAFTAQANFGGQPAEGETLDIESVISDDDGTVGPSGELADATVDFCTPSGTPTATPVSGSTGADTDDTGGDTATVHGECVTDTNGQCRFGIVITDANANASGTVTVWAETDDSDTREAGEPFDQSTISVTASGNEAVTNIACTPTTDSNPVGTRHEFRCTTTNAQGQPVGGATVLFDVTAGPNAEEIGPTNCPGTTSSDTGQTGAVGAEAGGGGSVNSGTGCGYNDSTIETPTQSSPPGTDTITVCVTQQAGAGETQTAGCDAHEAQTTITKAWVGPGTTISCTPDGQQANPGSTVLVTCNIADATGSPVSGGIVNFTETGPGTIDNFGCQNTNTGTSDANGTCTTTARTASNESGTQTVTGTLTNGNCAGTGNPAGPGNPNTGAPANTDCSDTATINWTSQTQTPPSNPECSDGVDNDGDGQTDFPNDPECNNPEDNSEADIGGRFNTSLTFRYDRNGNPPAFKGQVISDRKECTQRRMVKIRRVKKGRDPVVAKDRSNNKGNYVAVKKHIRRGKYYSRTPKVVKTSASGATLVCLGARSSTVKLRRN